MTFEQWLLFIGLKKKSADNYTQAIFGSINRWAKDANLINEDIKNITSLNEIKLILDKLKSLDDFDAVNTKGKKMYSNAIKHYINYLEDGSDKSVSSDISSIILDKDISETEKLLLVSARIGQGKFRKNLISRWKGCSLTRYTNTRILIASHIKPWKDSTNKERLDVNNGLLLLPNLDKTFDLGYISFDDQGTIIISSQLDNFDEIGIGKGRSIKIKEKNLPYLKFHREHVFENFK